MGKNDEKYRKFYGVIESFSAVKEYSNGIGSYCIRLFCIDENSYNSMNNECECNLTLNKECEKCSAEKDITVYTVDIDRPSFSSCSYFSYFCSLCCFDSSECCFDSFEYRYNEGKWFKIELTDKCTINKPYSVVVYKTFSHEEQEEPDYYFLQWHDLCKPIMFSDFKMLEGDGNEG